MGLDLSGPLSADQVDQMFAAGEPPVETPAPPAETTPAESAAPAAAVAPEPEQVEVEIDAALKALEEGGEEKPVEAKPPEGEEQEETTDVVTEKDADGGTWTKVRPQRWQHVYETYKAVRDIAQELGVDRLTTETARTFKDADDTLNAMRRDVLSGMPEKQKQFFGHYFDEADIALQNGIVQRDPVPTAIETFLGVAKERRPEVFDRAIKQEFRRIIDGLYETALRTGNESLLGSAQNIENHLYGTWRAKEQIQLPTDLDLRQRDLEASERRILELERTQSQREWNDFERGTRTAINSTVSGVLDGLLSKVKGLDDNRRKNVRARLDTELRTAFQTPQWKAENQRLYEEAELARSDKRGIFTEQFVKRYKARAQFVLRENLANAVNAEAAHVKQTADERKARIEAQQGKTPIASPGLPVEQRIPQPSGFVNRNDWAKHLDQIFTT